jgi:hypothetical protein
LLPVRFLLPVARLGAARCIARDKAQPVKFAVQALDVGFA